MCMCGGVGGMAGRVEDKNLRFFFSSPIFYWTRLTHSHMLTYRFSYYFGNLLYAVTETEELNVTHWMLLSWLRYSTIYSTELKRRKV